MLRSILAGAALAAALAAGPARPARADDAAAAADRQARLLAALAAGADCADKASPERAWCPAAGWAKASFAPLPKARLLVGVTVALVDGDVVETELRDKVTLSVVALGPDPAAPTDKTRAMLTLTAITPSAGNDDEALQVAKAVGGVAMVLKGKAKQVALPRSLADYAATLTAKYPLAKAASGQGWAWSGTLPGELRKVGDAWVAVERASTGVYVTVLTDKL